jgi:protein-tyrosine phosphatase
MHYTDIHCHCLPAIDDGPATITETLGLCRALVNDGIIAVIATPHQLGRFDLGNEPEKIRHQVNILNEILKQNGIALTILPGADVRLDERICQLLKDDKILTLADGGKYLLLEFPDQVLIDIEPLLAELETIGIQTIISHPERHSVLAKQPRVLTKWLRYSVHLQVTAASLLGNFGATAQTVAWNFLKSGLASIIATDAHNLDGRRPCMRAAYEAVKDILGKKVADSVCIENPLRVLKGENIPTALPVGATIRGKVGFVST